MSDLPAPITPEEQDALCRQVGSLAERGNARAVKHGGRSKRDGLVLARLGQRFAGVNHDVARLRKHLERLVVERLGKVTLTQRAKIITICRVEASIRSVEIGIRDDPKMSATELVKNRSMIVQWSYQRDRLIGELLGDNKQPVGAIDWDRIVGRYDTQRPSPES